MTRCLSATLHSRFYTPAWNRLDNKTHLPRHIPRSLQEGHLQTARYIYHRSSSIRLLIRAWVHSWNIPSRNRLSRYPLTVGFFVLSLAIRKPTPPHALVLFDLGCLFFGSCGFGEGEPVEGTLPMFFILVVVAHVHIAIGVDFASFALFLVLKIGSLVDSPIAVDGET
jgi:hypothetical protein